MKRRSFLKAATAGYLATALSATAAARKKRPNILVILVGDLRWDEIACAGHPFVRTPNIDRIAHEGARFRKAFCTTPLCSPVRASLLTGQYAHNHGIIDNTNRSRQSHELITFPRILHESGYETGYKYIHYVDDELYDLKEDPYEMKNVIGEPSLRATLEKLRADLARLIVL